MTKPRDVDDDHELDAHGRRRVRLRPRQGTEHRFAFARRWEVRRASRRSHSIWALVGLDLAMVGIISLILWRIFGKVVIGD